jgi:hypothetical protein
MNLVLLGIASLLSFHTTVFGAETIPPTAHSVNENRKQTVETWIARGVKFPCEDLIAKKKQTGPLPALVLSGEVHDHPYCQHRRNVIFSRGSGPQADWCASYESQDAPLGKGKDPLEIKGLENSHVKQIYGLLAGFNAMVDPLVPKDSYDFSLIPIELYRDLPFQEISRLAESKTGTDQDVLKKTVEALTKIRKHIEPRNEELIQQGNREILDLVDANRALFSSLMPDIIRKATDRFLLTRTEDHREDVIIPVGLKQEVDHYLNLIEHSVKNPNDEKCSVEIGNCRGYAVAWRDQIMSYNWALAYCENLAKKVPASEVHAVVGARHLPGMGRALGKEADFHGIPTLAVDGRVLAQAADQIVGQADKNGGYEDQAASKVALGGAHLGYSLQKDGVRMFVQEGFFDPVAGTAFQPEPGTNSVLRLFGNPDQINRLVSAFTGPLPETQPERDRKIAADKLKLIERVKSQVK